MNKKIDNTENVGGPKGDDIHEDKDTIGYRIVDRIFRIRKAIRDSQPDYYKECNL